MPKKLDQDQQIFKFLGDMMTIRLKRSDAGDLRFYMHSKVRMCVTKFDTLLPEVWFKDGGPNLKAVGKETIQDLAQWLVANGAQQTKKPRPYRAPRPIYD